jgi:hypothetical protein
VVCRERRQHEVVRLRDALARVREHVAVDEVDAGAVRAAGRLLLL